MDNQESLEFIRENFDELFGKRNINALDLYLDKDYFDDDIGTLKPGKLFFFPSSQIEPIL